MSGLYSHLNSYPPSYDYGMRQERQLLCHNPACEQARFYADGYYEYGRFYPEPNDDALYCPECQHEGEPR